MAINIDKFRKQYPLSGSSTETAVVDSMLQQTIKDFDRYQKSAPNTKKVYINDSAESIMATMVDVTDLSGRTDDKWMLVSLKHDISLGDIITWKNKKWLCVFDKEKTTETCFKLKISKCNYRLKLPFYSEVDNTPFIYESPVIIKSTINDIKLTTGSQAFPIDVSAMTISVKFDNYTRKLKKLDRIYAYDNPWEIIGIDYTNIDYDKDGEHGYLNLTVQSSRFESSDNKELGVCDYYKYFDKPIIEPVKPINDIILTAEKNKMNVYSKQTIIASTPENETIKFVFEGNSLGCTLIQQGNQCTLTSKGNIGIVSVKAFIEDTNISNIIKIEISNGW